MKQCLMEEDDNEIDCPDPINFKGIYYGASDNHFIDQTTGAHFQYSDLYRQLEAIKSTRAGLVRSKSHEKRVTLPVAIVSTQNRVTSHLNTQKFNESKLKNGLIENFRSIRRKLNEDQFHRTANMFNSISTMNGEIRAFSPKGLQNTHNSIKKFLFGKEAKSIKYLADHDRFNFVSLDNRKGKDLKITPLYKDGKILKCIYTPAKKHIKISRPLYNVPTNNKLSYRKLSNRPVELP